MCNNFPNIKVVRGNAFALLMPLKKRTFESCEPIDEDIDATQLADLVVKFGGVQYQASTSEDGVQIIIPADIAVGTYSIVLTAMYQGSAIRAAYESAVTIVDYNSQSDAQQYIAGSPIVLDAAYVIGGTLTDAELEALKDEYREKNAQLDQAIADAEEAKREWEQKAADLDGVAQESTSQEILTAVENIDIDTSDLAKEATLGTPLVGQPSTIFAAIAAVGGGDDSKQTIVDAINYMGGSATADMTWAQLAQQIEDLQIIAPNVVFNSSIATPIDIVAIMAQRGAGITRIDDSISTSVSDGFVAGNSSIEYIKMSNLSSIGQNSFSSMSAIRHIELPNLVAPTAYSTFSFISSVECKILLPSLQSINTSQFFRGALFSTLNLYSLNTTGSNNQFLGCTNIIDLITGAGFVSSISFSAASYNPTQAYRTDTSSLCFNADLEEYGQVFANNFEKWKWCIINHFAANLQDRSGMSAYTITFGSTVLSHFDAEMIAAFTDKNWTLA